MTTGLSPAPAAPAAPAAPKVQTSAPPAPRNTSGQFGPKDGATGAEPKETKAPGAESKGPPAETKGPPGETAAEKAVRLKGKLKRKGKEIDVDLDEQQALRALQVAWDLEEQRGEIAMSKKQVEELLNGLKNKPRETLKAQGVDIDELLAQQAAEQQKLEGMSEAERRVYELEQQLAQVNQERETEKTRLAEEQRTRARTAVVQRNIAQYKTALKSASLPDSPRLLNEMITTQELITSAGRPPLEPQQLAHATERRRLLELDEVANAAAQSPEAVARWRPALVKFAKLGLSGLKGAPLLEALGKDLVLSVCEATLESHGHTVAQQPRGEEPPPAPKPQQANALNEYEARELLRKGR